MQSSKSEQEMAQVISNYIYFSKGVRVRVLQPQNPGQHLLLVRAYEHAMKYSKK